MIKGEITKKITKISLFILAFLILNCKKSLEPISQPTWHLIYNAPTDGHYHDIFFVDQNKGWVVGDSAKILHTSDGSKSWTDVTPPLPQYILRLNSVFLSIDKMDG